MRILVLLPCYNDALSLAKLVTLFRSRIKQYVQEYLIVDESDDETSLRVLRILSRIDNIRVIHSSERHGKPYAWKIALESFLQKEFDALIEVNSDVIVRYPERIIKKLQQGYDVVTCYSHYSPRFIPWHILYEEMHKLWMRYGVFIPGGECIALSRHAIESIHSVGIPWKSVSLDDFLIALLAQTLGLKCTSVDCGLTLSLPMRLGEWILYRLRHNIHAVHAVENYLMDKVEEIRLKKAIENYRNMYKYALGHTILKNPMLSLFLFTFLFSLIPYRSEGPWMRLESEKTFILRV